MDTSSLSNILKEVSRTNKTKFSRDAVETLLTIHRNILHNKNDVTYRKIKPADPVFNRNIWSSNLLQSFMHYCGWREKNGDLIFNSDERLLSIIDTLIEHRRSIVPLEYEWNDFKQFEWPNNKRPQFDEKELELRRKAAIVRDKELAECLADMKYRKELAQSIRNQIKADRGRRPLQYTQPEKIWMDDCSPTSAGNFPVSDIPGTTNRLVTTSNNRPDTRSRFAQGVGVLPQSNVMDRLWDRPMSEKGLVTPETGILTPTWTQDKSYRLGFLRSKVIELNAEISRISKEIELLSKEQSTYLTYEKNAEDQTWESFFKN